MAKALHLLAGVAVASGSVVALCAGLVRAVAAGSSYDEHHVPAAPVALVLGAQVYPDGTPSRFLTARLELARRLYEAGKVQALLVSGDALAPEWDEPAAMRRHLLAAGVPDAAIVQDPAGFDTYDSCVRAKRIFGASSVIVVTQRYHLPRAVATARLVGLTAVGVGDHSVKRSPEGNGRSTAWQRGAVREVLACVKTVLDVLTRRDPVLGAPDDALRRALVS